LSGARLAAGLWLAAKLRLVTAAGGWATIIHKGDEHAGAVFVVLRHRDGTLSCVGPAPQSEADRAERRLEWRARQKQEAEVDAVIARERGFDRDLWCAEVECPEDLFRDVFGLVGG
jgi:hypothetical protein